MIFNIDRKKSTLLMIKRQPYDEYSKRCKANSYCFKYGKSIKLIKTKNYLKPSIVKFS